MVIWQRGTDRVVLSVVARVPRRGHLGRSGTCPHDHHHHHYFCCPNPPALSPTTAGNSDGQPSEHQVNTSPATGSTRTEMANLHRVPAREPNRHHERRFGGLQVAARMGVSVARVSQIEGGDVSTQDVLNRFVAALGGTLKLIAENGFTTNFFLMIF